MSEYERVKEALNEYQLLINDALKHLRRPFIVDLVTIVIVPVALAIAAYYFSNNVGFGATMGVGGLNAEERIRRGQTILISYWNECFKLKRSIKRLKVELMLCRPSDIAGLDKIKRLLRAYLGELESS